jgi:hypothetical protein
MFIDQLMNICTLCSLVTDIFIGSGTKKYIKNEEDTLFFCSNKALIDETLYLGPEMLCRIIIRHIFVK